MSILRTNQNGNNTSWGSSISVTLTGCVAGRLLVIAIGKVSTTTAPTVGQISGSNFGSLALAASHNVVNTAAQFWATVTANGNVTVTYTPAAAGPIAIAAMEYSGADTSNPVADSIGASSGWANSTATGNLVPSGNAVYVGVTMETDVTTITKDGAYAEAYKEVTAVAFEVCDLVGSGTKSIPWTLGTYTGVECIGVAYKEATSGAVVGPFPTFFNP